MTSPKTRQALEQASRKAGVGQPASAPSNTTRNTIAAMRDKAGWPAPSPSPRDLAAGDAAGEFGHHLKPFQNEALGQRDAAEKGRQKDAALRAADLRKHGQSENI